MMSPFVEVIRRGSVLEVTLNRPPANAISLAVSYELYEAFRTLRDDPDLRVGILTGGGQRVFSAGWDMKEVAAATSAAHVNDAAVGAPGGFAGLTELFDLHKPVIAAVNGVAVGGGFELALACDLIVAVEHAEFFLPEMQRGFVPDAGGVQVLPRRLPYTVAVELLLTGRRLAAREAAHWGLVNAVVPPDRLMAKAREFADAIVEGAPLAVQALLEILAATAPLSIEEAFSRTKRGRSGLPIYEKMLVSEDFLEGPRAFAEKRKPVWKGR